MMRRGFGKGMADMAGRAMRGSSADMAGRAMVAPPTRINRPVEPEMSYKKGGMMKSKMADKAGRAMKNRSADKMGRAMTKKMDGVAMKGKTKGKMVKMRMGGACK
jgi:hypothetical protein